ncbi:MAG: hypothetical protein GY866_43065 [Proteobacteria bacterium]|nr:hypothetical protein [Pseudomonadota bacterium]
MSTKVNVKGISGEAVSNFMLNCTDEDYRNWWPGTHLVFHTLKRFPNDEGVTITYTIKAGLTGTGRVFDLFLRLYLTRKGRLKNYLAFCRQNVQSFGDFCRQLMPSYFCTIPKFEKDLIEHADFEFTKLAEILSPDE